MSAESTNTPTCIGIMLDGNRRWAKAKGISTIEGHQRGAEVFKSALRWMKARRIPHVVAYVFSSENWNRDPAEVAGMMTLFRQWLSTRIDDLVAEDVHLHFVGDRVRFPADMQDMIRNAEEKTKDKTGIHAWICFSYGGRAELVAAARGVAASGEEITDESFAKHLWTVGMPDPDLIIRSGGHIRMSNFLPWQSVYSELFFLPILWPDFSEEALDQVLREFAERKRNFGT